MSDEPDNGMRWLLTPLEGARAMDESSEPNRPSAGAAYLLLALLVVGVVACVLIAAGGQ